MKYFIPLGGNPHCQMGLFSPLGDLKLDVMALIAPPRGDYAIAPGDGLTMFCGIAEPDEAACVAIRLNCCGIKP